MKIFPSKYSYNIIAATKFKKRNIPSYLFHSFRNTIHQNIKKIRKIDSSCMGKEFGYYSLLEKLGSVFTLKVLFPLVKIKTMNILLAYRDHSFQKGGR